MEDLLCTNEGNGPTMEEVELAHLYYAWEGRFFSSCSLVMFFVVIDFFGRIFEVIGNVWPSKVALLIFFLSYQLFVFILQKVKKSVSVTKKLFFINIFACFLLGLRLVYAIYFV